MNAKHLTTLEFPKILDRLAAYTSFSAGEASARRLEPATRLDEIEWQLATTDEARALLESRPDVGIGGAHDVRPQVTATQRGAVLPPQDLLDVRDTLVAARSLQRVLTRLEDPFPRLAHLAQAIQLCQGVVAEINRCLDERGEVRDDASPDLARVRRELRIAHDRIQDKLQNIISSSRNADVLQERIITQREGRYVVPVKTDFKGRLKGVVHDVSASGATTFIEPLSVVELNNTWRERQIEEQQEVNRILAQMSSLISEHAEEVEQTVEALAELDLVFARARYADAIGATKPEIVPLDQRVTVRFLGARHPLLDPVTVVPIDVVLDDETHVLVITGPNTGGKTVSLKTVGLLTLMTQAGLHIPVDAGSALSPFETVYADIGDEQSIEQSLSTFSAHLTNIISFLEKVDQHSLVLLDELGAGTDPAEGAALAHALLEHFRGRGVTTFVATHYPELKAYAQLTPGVCNASVEFDSHTLAPTYRLTIGLPGRSNAFAIARRLGVPEGIVQAAQQEVSPDELRAEDMLTDIHRLRIQAAEARDEANAARAEAERLTHQLRQRLEGIEQERQDILRQAGEEAERELDELRAEVRTLRRRLHAAAAVPLEVVTGAEEEIEALTSLVPETEPPKPPSVPGVTQSPIHPGDTVWVHPLNAVGQVLSMDEDEAEVQVGPARTRVDVAVLERRAGPEPEPEEAPIRVSTPPSPGVRLDLRGCTVEEALERLDRYLDRALRADLPWVRIIHGKGTGALRRAVRDCLSDHPLVSAYEPGAAREGGEGVTIAKLVPG